MDIENLKEENQLTETDNCPIHETPLEDGKCFQCGICYSCEGKM